MADRPEGVLAQARRMMAEVTPLRTDCGAVCGAACCQPLAGEETGMLLFPGEEALYRGKDGWRTVRTALGPMIVCGGTCAREDRPLSCRLFPLLPLIRPEGIRVAMDARAGAVCPLYASGVSGLRTEFTEAVRACGRILSEDPAQRRFLQMLTQQHDELRAYQRSFGR